MKLLELTTFNNYSLIKVVRVKNFHLGYKLLIFVWFFCDCFIIFDHVRKLLHNIIIYKKTNFIKHNKIYLCI